MILKTNEALHKDSRGLIDNERSSSTSSESDGVDPISPTSQDSDAFLDRSIHLDTPTDLELKTAPIWSMSPINEEVEPDDSDGLLYRVSGRRL